MLTMFTPEGLNQDDPSKIADRIGQHEEDMDELESDEDQDAAQFDEDGNPVAEDEWEDDLPLAA
jgi:hypothetical protein